MARDAVAALKTEAEAVAEVFQQAGCDRIALYREARKQLGGGNYTEKGRKKISRSSASRLIFERAVTLVTDAPIVTSLHLLLALIETPCNSRLLRHWRKKFRGQKHLKQAILTWIAAVSITQVSQRQPPSCNKFGKDLTQLARDGKISTVHRAAG